MRKAGWSCILSVCALASASCFAEDLPAVPGVQFVGAVNGNLCLTIPKTVNTTNLWFQINSLDFPETGWRTVKFTLRTSQIQKLNGTDVYSYYMAVDKPGETLIRVAETNAAGEYADWRTVGPVTNYLCYATTQLLPSGGELGPANGYPSAYINGSINSIREANYGKYQQSSNVWLGLYCSSPVSVPMIRYVPRQDNTGISRIDKNKFQCADDKGFLTNLVDIATIDNSSLSLGRVYEISIDPPVKAQYFRIMKTLPLNGEYVSIDEIEIVIDSLPKAFNISAEASDYTNNYPAVVWSVPADDMCNTGVLQRALSAAGPFADVTEWTDATTGGTFVDSNALVGVTYYYRVKAQCVGGGLRGIHCSDVVPYARSRRLERSWEDLTTLKDGVSVMYPYKWAAANQTGGKTEVGRAFDGSTDTYTEITAYTNSIRIFNAAVGVDLGGEYHICGALVYPRESVYDSVLARTRAMSICGADSEEFIDSYSALSPELGGFQSAQWQYTTTTNKLDKFRYVFLWSTTHAATYGDVAEIGFFGYTDKDIEDSGLLIPPTRVSCETNATGVALSWDRGWNNASYRVERRRVGTDGAWTEVASLAADALSFTDDTVPRSGMWEWRITVEAEGSDPISSLPCSCYVKVESGFVIKFF